jgi:hypothetical protein
MPFDKAGISSHNRPKPKKKPMKGKGGKRK